MKYKDIFKSWFFWIAVVLISILEIRSNLRTYGSLFGAEYLGIALGSFIFVTLIGTLIFGVNKIFSRKNN